MDGSLISDAVNLCSRMENSRAFLTRLVSRVRVKGRQLAAKQTVGAPCSVPGAGPR